MFDGGEEEQRKPGGPIHRFGEGGSVNEVVAKMNTLGADKEVMERAFNQAAVNQAIPHHQ